MKRIYIEPQLTMVHAEMESNLAAYSPGNEGNPDTGTDVSGDGKTSAGGTTSDPEEGEDGAKFHRSWDFWD